MQAMQLREGHHYIIEPVTGCWHWQLFIDSAGYGQASRGRAHRVAYQQHVGPIPEGHHLHHMCPNRDCVNPGHLVPIAPSRHIAKHKRADSPLTETLVREIRAQAASGEAYPDLAAAFGLPYTTITDLVLGRIWADVGGHIGRAESYCQLEGCGRLLTGNRHQQYCSPTHRNAAYQQRLKAA